jgi:hypothetical protein
MKNAKKGGAAESELENQKFFSPQVPLPVKEFFRRPDPFRPKDVKCFY